MILDRIERLLYGSDERHYSSLQKTNIVEMKVTAVREDEAQSKPKGFPN